MQHGPHRPASVPRPIALDQLPRGASATVLSLHPAPGDAQQALPLRLMEIGFLPGERVRVLARGFPAADPLAVRVGQATFALRRHEAALVQVQPEAPQGRAA
ncbi:FeoA family protein [Pulveribacter suum]|uniref:Ferrous iron transport protein A n=1 Tax=Pulveribacter suum TaxID=2116657 RepID=A0A2P1NJX3_9BURK|nr:FeoA family protein [Pulveribacter suum]AVP57333.1 ferrous iron transport protein A [Pulveribacter suum]